MKRNKLIGIAIALGGMLVAFGSSLALYKKAASDAEIGFSQGTYSGQVGAITYKINNGTSGAVDPSYCKNDGTNGGAGLSVEYPQIHYEFALSADYANDLNAQNATMGNLLIEIGSLNSMISGKCVVYAQVKNYVDGSIGASHYGSALIDNETLTTTNANSSTYTVRKNICVASAGTQVLDVWFKFAEAGKALTDADMMTLNEQANLFSLSVTWGQPERTSLGTGTLDSEVYTAAYIVGTGNLWTENLDYEMHPDINNTTDLWSWEYNNLTGSTSWTECKGKIGDVWSKGDNFNLTNGTTYNLHWTGASSGSLYQPE